MPRTPHESKIDEAEEPSLRVARLYTPAMLAELVHVPVSTIRRWQRQGILQACQSVRRLSYFDFSEVTIARHLAAMLHAGCSLKAIDRQLSQLERHFPEEARPLLNPALVVVGRKLTLRRGDDLSEPGGQLLIDFDTPDEAGEAQAWEVSSILALECPNELRDQPAHTIPLQVAHGNVNIDDMHRAALAWEEQGELARAAESYRLILAEGGPTADVNFALANVLYRQHDLSAARERFYMAVELDEEFVEARAMLGCVLSEQDELELAVAAFRGALRFHGDYADVHYHLAGVLDRLGELATAKQHWFQFLELSPESPWAETARARVGLVSEE